MRSILKALVLISIGIMFITGPGTPPWSISIQALPDGNGVKLTWPEPSTWEEGSGCWGGKESEYLYIVSIDDVVVDTVAGTEYCIYERCSEAAITILKDGQGDESTPISFESTAHFTLEVYELNGYGASGIGFGVLGESVNKYMMSDSTNRDEIDCYFTDWTPDYQGPYYLASPDQVASDPGGEGFAPTGWRRTMISGDLEVTDIEDVEIAPAQNYGYLSDSVQTGSTHAVLTQDGYYGLIHVIGINTVDGEIDIKARFQPIKGLRWM